MAYLIQRGKMLAAKIESTAYTYALASPVQADLIPAFDIQYKHSIEHYQRDELLTHFAKQDHIVTRNLGELTFKMYVAGGASAGVAGYIDVPLTSCGMSKTIVAVTSVTYKPVSLFATTVSSTAAQQSCSFNVLEDGVAYGLSGCQGNVKFTFECGKPGIAEFSFKGVAVAPAAFAAPSQLATLYTPPVFTYAQLTSAVPAAWSAFEFEKFSVDLGNDITPVIDANSNLGSGGLCGYAIQDRKITGSFDPTMPAIGTKDVYAAFRAGTAGQIQTGVIPNSGGSAGNKYQLTIARAQYLGMSWAERRKTRSLGIDFEAVSQWSDADGTLLTLAWT